MTYEIASVICGGPGLVLPNNEPFTAIDNWDNRMTPCEAYQKALDQTRSDVLIYIHDDVTIHDPNWLHRIMFSFAVGAQETVAVGLGGATSLGRPDLYRKPYNIWNMARGGYASNQTDAETHGERFTGTRRVVVLDAFLMAVRVAWLRQIGGWPVGHITHHCLDLWLAAEAARAGREIWQVGAPVTHYGGGSSTKPKYAQAKWLKGGSLQSDHQEPHRWLYENYRDVLPIIL